MLIIGCDFHPGLQQVAIFDNLSGEMQEKRLQHGAEAEQSYRSLAGQEVRVGREACGHHPWFERWLQELGIEGTALAMVLTLGPNRWVVGNEVPLQEWMSDELGLDIKNVLPERNGAFVKPKTPTGMGRRGTLDRVRRR